MAIYLGGESYGVSSVKISTVLATSPERGRTERRLTFFLTRSFHVDPPPRLSLPLPPTTRRLNLEVGSFINPPV